MSRSAKVPGWESRKTLVSVTAYHCLGGTGEASNTPDTPPYPFTPSPAFAHSSTHIWTGCDLVPLDPAIFSASGSRGGIIYIRGRIGFRYSAPLPFSAETSLAVETISSITAG